MECSQHVNVTVSDPDKTADLLGKLFGWHIRWRGAATGNGESIHVGNNNSYVALYKPANSHKDREQDRTAIRNLNHIGVVVDDLEATETRVKAAGFTTHSHADYEPGKRFYFDDHDGIEIEVVSYV